MYGPNTPAVQAIMDRISALTEDECKQLTAAWEAAMDPAWEAAWYAAMDAAWDAAYGAAWGAAMDAAWEAVYGAAWDAARQAAYDASRPAVLATVTYDLATDDGPYTIAQRDLLLAPWVSVCGR